MFELFKSSGTGLSIEDSRRGGTEDVCEEEGGQVGGRRGFIDPTGTWVRCR